MRLSSILVLLFLLTFACDEQQETTAATDPSTATAPAEVANNEAAPEVAKTQPPRPGKQQRVKKATNDREANKLIKQKFAQDPAGLLIERMEDVLELTDEQKAEIREYAKKFDLTSGSELDQRNAFRAFRKKTIDAILTKEQIQKFESSRDQ